MSADLLRRAADKLRKDVAAVSALWRDHPWFPVFTDSESLTGVRACPVAHAVGALSDSCDACDDFETYSEGLAGYVAAMHPAVALALADLLEAVDGHAAKSEHYAAAYAVARAVLREDGESA